LPNYFSRHSANLGSITQFIGILYGILARFFFQSTFSIIAALSEPCGPTPLSAAGTISTPGTYCLTNNITGTIAITSGQVVLDLNGYVITGKVTISNNSAIVQVKNGLIENTDAGVDVNGASAVLCENLVIRNCSLWGIQFTNIGSTAIIRNVHIDSSQGGISLTFGGALVVEDTTITNLTNSAASVFGIFSQFCGRTIIQNTSISNLVGTGQAALGIQVFAVGNLYIFDTVVENILGDTAGFGMQIIGSAQVEINNCDIKNVITNGFCFGIDLGISTSDIIRNCRLSNLISTGNGTGLRGISTEGSANILIENSCTNLSCSITSTGAAYYIAGDSIICDRCVASDLNNARAFLVPAGGLQNALVFNGCNATNLVGTSTTLAHAYDLADGVGVVNRCTANQTIGNGFNIGNGSNSAAAWMVARCMAINAAIGFSKVVSAVPAPAALYNVAGLNTTNYDNWPFVDPVGRQIACPGDSGPQIGYNAAG